MSEAAPPPAVSQVTAGGERAWWQCGLGSAGLLTVQLREGETEICASKPQDGARSWGVPTLAFWASCPT